MTFDRHSKFKQLVMKTKATGNSDITGCPELIKQFKTTWFEWHSSIWM